MKCPVCKTTDMAGGKLEENLPTMRCEQCGGQWLSAKDYAAWRDEHRPVRQPFSEISLEVKQVQEAKLCPDCGLILIKYRVGHGLDFFVDHCNGCGGLWLDKNEWNALKEKNLHDEVYRIFSTSWQREIRNDRLRQKLESLYINRFGEDGYRKVQETRDWIQSHAQKAALLQFIAEDDPFSL